MSPLFPVCPKAREPPREHLSQKMVCARLNRAPQPSSVRILRPVSYFLALGSEDHSCPCLSVNSYTLSRTINLLCLHEESSFSIGFQGNILWFQAILPDTAEVLFTFPRMLRPWLPSLNWVVSLVSVSSVISHSERTVTPYLD